ncbi:hypothetical protein SSBR45G_00190 [Bradyrhizobium sp. SSBR45G]|uniref:hypothetical protein n=1 Tax=unclassified Bradyrhizobium TaxID=2631580 RepID=UPI0023429B29|nr:MULTISPECIES: hypothetical protein [unclassified Bradyrhizobium]GLH75111.1 hypothetical protein SSBR45G_00190 [Bradyrhizobium sp. SSBR45G]GLH83102.1 hypothetical protein SSBR45R_05620 [Bradyrhizobium sp. SSBR45R]
MDQKRAQAAKLQAAKSGALKPGGLMSSAPARRSPLVAPMAQQRAGHDAGPTPQGLVRLIGCHDPAKRILLAMSADSRPPLGKSVIE